MELFSQPAHGNRGHQWKVTRHLAEELNFFFMIGDGLYPQAMVSNKPFLLKLLLSRYIITAMREVTETWQCLKYSSSENAD